MSNPSILFLDEPTSGLDSRAAQIVMRGVSNIVGSGRSVICTIHQPSRRLFSYFDHLLLLKRGGEVVYFGPTGEEAKDLLVRIVLCSQLLNVLCPRKNLPEDQMYEDNVT